MSGTSEGAKRAWESRARQGAGSGGATQLRSDYALRPAPSRATLEFNPVRPFNDPRGSAPLTFGTYDHNLVEGHIAGFEVTTQERGLTDKVTPRTKAMIEDALSKPEIVAAMREAGINAIRLIPSTNKHTAGMDGNVLLLHPRTAEVIAKSTVPERRAGGLERVIMHEAGHALWNQASDSAKAEFQRNVTPEHEAYVRRIVNLGEKLAGTEFHPRTKEDRAAAEIHAETQAMRWSDPQAYRALPPSLRAAAEAIWPRSHA